MSKRLTRLPGDEPPPDPEHGARVLGFRPLRTLDTWKETQPDGLVVVTHAKNFGRLEGALARALKGSPVVNRRLDEFGSQIWLLCDGEHSVADIARALEDRFHERFEPAVPRTLKFITILAERGLVVIREPPAAARGGEPA
jgi:hypothetical protein